MGRKIENLISIKYGIWCKERCLRDLGCTLIGFLMHIVYVLLDITKTVMAIKNKNYVLVFDLY